MFAIRANRARTSQGPNRVTLQRALSKLGYCSRSQAETLIPSGNVLLNAKVCTDPHTWIDLKRDVVTVAGKALKKKEPQYVLFHKPRGVVTTRADERGRKTIYDVLDPSFGNLKPVGRLDKETSGLLLLTNDHWWAERLTNPKLHVRKLYEVQIAEPISPQAEDMLRSGISIRTKGKDYRTKPATLEQKEKLCYRIGLTEGKNRQIRKMFEALGSTVVSLKRVAVGSLELASLGEGQWRVLSENEIESLKNTEGERAVAENSKRN
jgi:23S rRNA pseudouridine2605 synthase